jgi:hypothetical protein
MHKFEEAGLGLAPFRVVGWSREVGPKNLGNGMSIGAPGQPMGTCDYCGQGIAICVQVKSADGRRFVVGCDCAKKCDDETNTATTAVKRIQAEIRREAKAKKDAEKRAAIEADIQAQRDRNGGLTDWELQQEQIRREREGREAHQRAHYTAINMWLIESLKEVPYQSSFVDSMIDSLEKGPVGGLSDRCLGILEDIYGKQHGRRNSKSYKAACDLFWDKVDSSLDNIVSDH